MNLLDNIIAVGLLNKGDNLAASMDELAAAWQPITTERQPYTFNLMPQLRAELEVAGFTVVATPVFKVGESDFIVKTDCFSSTVLATDLPQDIYVANKNFTSDLIDFLRVRNRVYVYSVIVFRMAMLGYLPPTVFVYVRSASGLKSDDRHKI